MMYKAKIAVCSDMRTKHSTQNERDLEFLNVKPGGYERNCQGLKGSAVTESKWSYCFTHLQPGTVKKWVKVISRSLYFQVFQVVSSSEVFCTIHCIYCPSSPSVLQVPPFLDLNTIIYEDHVVIVCAAVCSSICVSKSSEGPADSYPTLNIRCTRLHHATRVQLQYSPT